MAKQHTRSQVLERLQDEIGKGKLILGAGAGTGISAKFIEKGGADLIIIYNSGKYRMAGIPSIAGYYPFGDANEIVCELGEREVLPVVKETPVVAGVLGTDLTRDIERFLQKIKTIGFSGVNNFPTVSIWDGRWRTWCEELGMGFDREVKMIAAARKLDLFTIVYVFQPHEAVMMAEAGADAIIAHMGVTTKGSTGAQTAMTLDEAAKKVQEICDSAKKVRPETLVLSHGGPIAEPADAEYIQNHTHGVVGFIGASSLERIPVEEPIAQTVQRFKAIKVEPSNSNS
jgi:predicted TIM-barrel enzyme